MRILFFSDPHNADIPPIMRTESYSEDILKKQELLIPIAKKCDFIICGGDIFHSKNLTKISYRLCNDLLDIYREYGKILIVIGSHDVDGNADFSERPINLFSYLPNVRVVTNELYQLQEHNILFMTFGGQQEYKSADIVLQIKKNLLKFKKEELKNFLRVVIAHAPIISISNKEYPFEVINFSELSRYAHLFLVGHLHDYQFSNNRVLSPGALSRGVLVFDDNFNRKILYGIIEVNDLEYECSLHELLSRPAEDVFKVQQKLDKMKENEESSSITDVISSLGSVVSCDKLLLIERLKLMEIPLEVKTKAIQILEKL